MIQPFIPVSLNSYIHPKFIEMINKAIFEETLDNCSPVTDCNQFNGELLRNSIKRSRLYENRSSKRTHTLNNKTRVYSHYLRFLTKNKLKRDTAL